MVVRVFWMARDLRSRKEKMRGSGVGARSNDELNLAHVIVTASRRLIAIYTRYPLTAPRGLHT